MYTHPLVGVPAMEGVPTIVGVRLIVESTRSGLRLTQKPKPKIIDRSDLTQVRLISNPNLKTVDLKMLSNLLT